MLSTITKVNLNYWLKKFSIETPIESLSFLFIKIDVSQFPCFLHFYLYLDSESKPTCDVDGLTSFHSICLSTATSRKILLDYLDESSSQDKQIFLDSKFLPISYLLPGPYLDSESTDKNRFKEFIASKETMPTSTKVNNTYYKFFVSQEKKYPNIRYLMTFFFPEEIHQDVEEMKDR